MSHVDRMMRHEALMTQMAERNGVDLNLAGQVGLIDPDEVFQATLACSGCSDVDACETHLATGQEGFPSVCRNKEILRELQGEMARLGLSDS